MTAEFSIELKKGVAVNILITPRLYVYKGREGINLEADADNIPAVMSLYADVLYLGALNWWELSGKDVEDFGHKRMDFHIWAAENPDDFGRIVTNVVRLLSGKSLAELAEEKKKEAEPKKKSCWRWIMEKLRRFLWGNATRRSPRRGERPSGSFSSCVKRPNKPKGDAGREQGGRCS